MRLIYKKTQAMLLLDAALVERKQMGSNNKFE